jgi:Protein of unknown function (DUF2380)
VINLLVLAGSASLPFPPEVQKEAGAGSGIPNCNGCERDLAEKIGAEWAAWGIVQKVSNLILNINLYMEGRADRKNRICPQRRYSRQHRRIVASWSQLRDPELGLGAALT